MSGIITSGLNRSSGLLKAAVTGGNTPGFLATRGLDGDSGDNLRVLVNDNTLDQVEFNQEVYDSDGCYDTSNFRFTPNKAGFYFLQTTISAGSYTDRQKVTRVFLRKNGGSGDNVLAGAVYHGEDQSSGYDRDQDALIRCSAIEQFNGTTDYVEVWCLIDITVYSPRINGGNLTDTYRQSNFQGFFIGT